MQTTGMKVAIWCSNVTTKNLQLYKEVTITDSAKQERR